VEESVDFYVWFFVLEALAIFRLTRLIVDDEFPPVRVPREWIVIKADRAARLRRRYASIVDLLADLVTCRYCASGWVALAVTLAGNYGGDLELGWVNGVIWWFAVWGLAVFIYSYHEPVEHLRDTEDEHKHDEDEPIVDPGEHIDYALGILGEAGVLANVLERLTFEESVALVNRVLGARATVDGKVLTVTASTPD
jgi:hypothetical protein